MHGHGEEEERNLASAQIVRDQTTRQRSPEIKEERHSYSGKICGVAPGKQPSLCTEWCSATKDLAYFIILETAEKALLDILATAHDKIAETLAKEGILGCGISALSGGKS